MQRFDWEFDLFYEYRIIIKFNIDNVLQHIDENVKRYTKSTLDLQNDLDLIQYSKTKKVSVSSLSDKPILLVEIFSDNSREFLVIDGNHRLTNAINENISGIDYILINRCHLSRKCFSDEFSWIFYHFLLDVKYLNIIYKTNMNAIFSLRKKIAVRQLIKSSYQNIIRSFFDHHDE